ncbi:UDP-N-acetylmuramate--L-alanine ligase [Terrimonas sp.]|uniref:UDP-N-acetylmuramate--L-alanine ligase n=1 Tax=Terrimonas sp. TaxID=1914338 RepID=UPI000D52271B|nr:UDP-N-acetylmuramate--L-alanine ligase [Terrimonas sp.]PVD53249.1 UDP-N-acetylmuramate--L-alanine ligase [Terrimonas sp.]
MKELKDIQKVYFIGIGGIGMSALARYFKSLGKDVSGYDRTETTLTQQLTAEDINIHYTDDVELAPKDTDIVVYTPAIPKNHTELLYYQQHEYDLLKRSDVLGMITRSSFNICVAGTHGKTTITTMIAHILRHTGYGCNAFLGGIAANYNSNFWSSPNNVCVVEADEYDRSFLKLSPDIAVISAMDADHLDIYGTAEEMENAFIAFAGKIKKNGTLFSKFGLEHELKADHHYTYSIQQWRADIHAENIRSNNGGYLFDVKTPQVLIKDIRLYMGGLHNVENVSVAIGVAKALNIDDEKIKAAVADFKGVKRRFEYIVPVADGDGIVYVDDYAHHPAELEALLSGAKLLFPQKKCTIIFQPHLFSRTKDFADAFAASLDLADETVLLPIYPARELPMEGVTSEMILSRMKNPNKSIKSKEALMNWVEHDYKQNKNALLITAGAGDIDKLIEPIKKIITA